MRERERWTTGDMKKDVEKQTFLEREGGRVRKREK